MRKTVPAILLIALGCFIPAFPAVYYIASNGNDSGTGTLGDPLASIQRAQELVSPGDTVYIRGGTYSIAESDISKIHQDLFACISFLDKSGTAGARIRYWNYPDETLVLDFSAVTPANRRVVGIWVEGDYIHIRGLEMTGVQVTITTHTESYCVYSWGNHNIFERLDMHDNQGTGLRHRRGGYNLFLNCDACRNHDYTSEDGKGGNTDGFGCHPNDGGTGNVFRGCRAWFNSDDGYDVLGAAEPVLFENCWAFYNGYSTGFLSLGDGNGFKAGGYGSTAAANLPVPIPSHTVRFCLAVRNKASGFYSNHHIAGNTWYNNSACWNGTNYNMLNRLADNVTDVPGYGHILRNNLSYSGSHIRNVDYTQCDISNNSFDLDITIRNGDFLSLDTALLTAPRNEDGSLPGNDFMRLSSWSQLVDAGVDIGFAFCGGAPDLGAFELDHHPFPRSDALWYEYYTPPIDWEPSGSEPGYSVRGLTDEDTLINGVTYHKLFKFLNDLLLPEQAYCLGYIRESEDRKVWFRNPPENELQPPDTGDLLLYDFAVRAGDTIPGNSPFINAEYLIVSEVDSIPLEGQWRRRIHFQVYEHMEWIEGIGSERGLLFGAGDQPTDGSCNDLVCYYEGGRNIFHNGDFEQCYAPPYGTRDYASSDPVIRAYPIPCYGEFITIESPRRLREVMLVNATGQVLGSFAGGGESLLRIPVAGLEPGIYLIRASGPDGSMDFVKILIGR